jgi:riboflavin kinase/FMN adenylyltransferase
MNSLSELNDKFPNTPIALIMGNFDGVHLGHSKLILTLKEKAKDLGAKLAVMTFTPHPYKILKPDAKNFLLSSYKERRDKLKNLGIEFLIERPFDRDFSTLSPHQFLEEEVFIHPFLKAVYVGHDFSFGENKSGTYEMIFERGKKTGIIVEKQEKYQIGNERFSSSFIREALMKGQIENVSLHLGSHFKLEGLVVKGEGRGKKLGFPTANLQIDEDLIVPSRGVYITKTHIGGMIYHSMTNVGLNPTFKTLEKIQVETNIFDFSQDIYGEKIWVEFLKKLRDEKKFPSVNDLVAQLNIDSQISKEYFK